jgi:hypothetical protein
MTTDDRGCGMAWDFDNMLQSFAANNVLDLKNATYEYDAIGRRVAKNVAQSNGGVAVVQVFANSGLQTIACTSPIYPELIYIFGSYIDDCIATHAHVDGTLCFHYTNDQYSPIAATSTAAVIYERYHYSAYGNQATIEAANGSSLTGASQSDLTAGGWLVCCDLSGSVVFRFRSCRGIREA